MWIIATVIFAIAAITDFFDGQIARSRHLITNFGKFADPLADKMLVMTAFILLVGQHVVPAWVAVIIVCRELAVTGLRLIVAETSGKVIAAAWPGKIKTATQMFSIVFLLLNFDLIGLTLLYICLFFTVYSGIDYFVKNWGVFAHSI
ncbi:MAG: CDP-diacylglycerol--glycerol-3-phosphate 3-phosphatidyltransferase [Acetilactobacillus jinshanensis]